MKRIFLFVTIMCVMAFSSCSEDYDDTELRNEINSLELRVAALEELCKQMNTNITSLQTIVAALQQNDCITNVAPITKDSETIGYTITFAKSGSITIYDGVDGNTPLIGVMKDSDENYYWTLNGEWLLNDNGEKIRAEGKNGTNGTNGSNGVDGKDGVTPKLKVENEYWYVSYDNGISWNSIGEADVINGDNVFEDVDIDEDSVTFTLSDGTKFTLPIFDGNSPVGAAPANNEIWYTTVDGSTVMLGATDGFGANIVSNIMYKNGVGVITFDGKVTAIPDRAFGFGSNFSPVLNTIKTIILPNSVTYIGEYAFSGHQKLTKVNVPEGVISIGERAFYECESLVNITLPNSVKSIGDEAFWYCESLESITIPNNVTSIGDRVFMGCKSLSAFNGNFASNDNKCLIVDGKLKAFAGSGVTEYTIPDEVTSIGSDVFMWNEVLKKITISDNVTSIKENAFSDCISLEEVIIGKSVLEMGERAFGGCISIKGIVIPDSVTHIKNYVFYGCHSLENVIIGKSVLEIGERAFSDCAIKKIVVSDSVECIKDAAFADCSDMEEITVGAKVAELGEFVFGNCDKLKSIYCKPVSPPKIKDLGFGGTRAFNYDYTIYVPNASLSAYKLDEGWKFYEGRIVGYDFN